MEPVKRPEHNHTYRGNGDDVGDLSCRVEGNTTYGHWQPSGEEVMLLLAGGQIEQAIIGHPIPPTSLVVIAPDRLDPEVAKCGYWQIADERFRQVNEEGYDEAHDDSHTLHELPLAAVAYALDAAGSEDWVSFWPWGEDEWKGGKGEIDSLRKAGALIAAEIDRLERADAAGG